jgi:hypothetical protein
MRQARGLTFVRASRARVLAGVGVLGLVISACATSPADVSRKEERLTQAGFEMRPANTPERRTMLAALPADHFVQRVRGDVIHYVYADPRVCDCLYVGSRDAYERYEQIMLQQHLADQQSTSVQAFSSSSWNWSVWREDGFGDDFGPERGW